MKGLSETNLRHMRAFAQAWPEWEVCSQAVSKLPWEHNRRVPCCLVWYESGTESSRLARRRGRGAR
jgi:hypothetical protein